MWRDPVWVTHHPSMDTGGVKPLGCCEPRCCGRGVHTSVRVPVFSFFPYKPRIGVTRSRGNSVFNFLTKHQAVYCPRHLHSHQPRGRVPISPHVCHHSLGLLGNGSPKGCEWCLTGFALRFPEDSWRRASFHGQMATHSAPFLTGPPLGS